MRIPKRIGAALAGAAIASIAFSGAASAATLTYSPFGEAIAQGGGAYKLVSDAAPGYGGLDFNTPTGITFADIEVLATTQVPEADDTCVGGSPRFQINLDTDGDGDFDGNVFVYTELGAACPSPTGDLAETGGPGDVAGRYDSSQLIAGTQVTTYSAVLAALGSAKVLGIQLVVDSGWLFADGEQAVTVNPTVEVNLPTATSKNACKKGGWQNLDRTDGTTFKNQGDCIQYVNTGK